MQEMQDLTSTFICPQANECMVKYGDGDSNGNGNGKCIFEQSCELGKKKSLSPNAFGYWRRQLEIVYDSYCKHMIPNRAIRKVLASEIFKNLQTRK